MEKEIEIPTTKSEWEKDFREFFKKQFDVSSWTQITDNVVKLVEEIRQSAIDEKDRTIKFLKEQVDGIPNPSYSQAEVDRVVKKAIEEVLRECYAIYVNNSKPSNEQMNCVRAIRNLAETKYGVKI